MQWVGDRLLTCPCCVAYACTWGPNGRGSRSCNTHPGEEIKVLSISQVMNLPVELGDAPFWSYSGWCPSGSLLFLGNRLILFLPIFVKLVGCVCFMVLISAPSFPPLQLQAVLCIFILSHPGNCPPDAIQTCFLSLPLPLPLPLPHPHLGH